MEQREKAPPHPRKREEYIDAGAYSIEANMANYDDKQGQNDLFHDDGIDFQDKEEDD